MDQTRFFEGNQIYAVMSKIDGLYEQWSKKHGMNQYEVSILYDLLTGGGKMLQKQISACYGVPKQTINNVVLSLVAKNYLCLITNPKDKREKWIALTLEGEEYAMQKLAVLFEIDKREYDRMGQERVNLFFQTLTDFADFLEQEMQNQSDAK